MTKIKTAQAWFVWTPRGNVYKTYTPISGSGPASTVDIVVIVHGLTEAEVHEAAELLDKSREVCVHKKITHDGPYQFRAFGGDCDNDHYSWNDPNECPSCGRKVVIV